MTESAFSRNFRPAFISRCAFCCAVSPLLGAIVSRFGWYGAAGKATEYGRNRGGQLDDWPRDRQAGRTYTKQYIKAQTRAPHIKKTAQRQPWAPQPRAILHDMLMRLCNAPMFSENRRRLQHASHG